MNKTSICIHCRKIVKRSSYSCWEHDDGVTTGIYCEGRDTKAEPVSARTWVVKKCSRCGYEDEGDVKVGEQCPECRLEGNIGWMMEAATMGGVALVVNER